MNPARDIDRICDEFEAAWQAGQVPKVEDFVAKIDEEHRTALLEALMLLDLTYRGKLGETLNSGDAADSGKLGSGFDATLDSDSDGPELLASSATRAAKRVKYFGEYELLSEIARGGMGVVYKARQVKLNRIVALKMILSGELAGSEAVQRFQSEAEAAANLDHPGIVPIYEIGEHEGQHYFSMGFIDGPSLQGKLNAGPMPAKEAARLCRKIAEAVAYAHSKNVIHRDLKPANVLIDGNGEPKVTDFGLAKKVEGDSDLTRTGAVMGTPSYMPPEQALGQTDKIGPAADVYSLGAILYCMLTGRPPFQAANVVDTLKQVVDNEPVTPRTLDNKIPRDLETICLKCLEKNPANRYATAKDFVDELERFEKGEPIKARRISDGARVVRWGRRNPIVASFLALTTILLGVAFGSLSSESKQRKRAEHQSFVANQQKYLAELASEKSLDAETKERTARIEVMSQRDRLANAERTAVAARDQAIQSKESTEATLARSNYYLALARWDSNRVADANDSLERIPHKYRNFEWRLAKHQFIGGGVTCFGHTRSVRSASFSPDGLQVVSASDDLTVKLWDATSGEEIKSLTGHTDQTSSVGFSPDGKLILSASHDKTIKLWDAISGTEVRTFAGHEKRVNCACFSPDGSRIASISNDDTIKLWDTTSGEELKTLKWESGNRGTIFFSPDGATLVTTGMDEIRIWATSSGENLQKFEHVTRNGHIHSVDSACFSPDGSLIVSAGTDKTIKIWDVKLGEEIRTLQGHTEFIKSVSFSPDGALIASASNDSTVRLWKASTGEEVRLFKGHLDSVHSVRFSSDGSRLVTASEDGTVKLWQVTGEDHRELRSVLNGAKSFVNCVTFSADGSIIASAFNDGAIRLWSASTGEQARAIQIGGHPVSSLCFSPDGTQIASTGLDKSIKVWRTSTGDELLTLDGHSHSVHCVAFSPDGTTLASGSDDQTIRLWNVEHGTEISTFTTHDSTISGISFSPNGSLIASASNACKLWDVSSGKIIRTFDGHGDTAYSISFSPDGKTVVAGGFGGTIHIWDVSNAAKIRAFKGHAGGVQGAINSVRFSPDGRLIASASTDRTVRLWDVPSGEELRTLNSHSDFVKSVCFSPDSKRMASGSFDGTICVWDAPDDQGELKILKADNSSFGQLQFSANGTQLRAASSKSQLVWSTETGEVIQDAHWNPSASTLTRSADGRWFAVSSNDRILLIDHSVKATPAEKERRELAAKPKPDWHKEQADIALEASNWFAAAFHLAWLVKTKSATVDNSALANDVVQLREAFEKLDDEQRNVLRPLVETTKLISSQVTESSNYQYESKVLVPSGHE